LQLIRNIQDFGIKASADPYAGDAGLDVEWTDVDVPLEQMKMESEGEGEWKGVRRRYWTLEKYRLPICKFMG